MISGTCESVQKNSKIYVITVLERENIEKEEHNIWGIDSLIIIYF